MKARLVVNPAAGRDTGPALLERINERLRGQFDHLDIVLTIGDGDAISAARDAALAGYHQVIVAGGDGTLNEVLNGIAGVSGALERVRFALLPLGTGNDLARALGIPPELDAAIDLVAHGREVRVDVARLNDRYFLNASAAGFAAEASDGISSELKTVAGRFAYLLGGAQALLAHEPAWGHFTFTAASAALDVGADLESSQPPEDGMQMEVSMMAVCNGPTAGGGHRIAPAALLDDGALDVCVVPAMPIVEFLPLLARMSSGDHVGDRRVVQFRASTIDVLFNRPVRVNTDGQAMEVDRCAYSVERRAARFVAASLPDR
jgi:diacylglycerol kinase (ATP)